MGELWDALMGFFGQHGEQTKEQQAANAIAIMQGIQDIETLAALWMVLPPGVKELGTVLAAKEVTQGRIELQGAKGPYAPVARALFDGFGDISGEIESAIAASLRANLVPGSPDSKHAFDEVLDVLLDGMLQAYRVGGKDVPDDVAESLKAALIPVLQLGLTVFTATALAELIHPTKEMGWSHVSHFLYEMVGYKNLSEAYTMPLRRALIEYPIQVALNTALQPYHPSEGTITGLARKREATRDQYREAMRALGIQEEWIESQLNGFWSDPRLFEIIRILDVALPDPVCPREAAEWLERAELGSYTGEDWWLALKFAKAGYDDIDIPVLIKAVRKRYIQSELGNIRTIQRNQYKKGKISRAEYERILESRGITPSEAAELLDAVVQEQATDNSDEMQRLYELKYTNGRMTDEEIRAAFEGLKLDPEYIDARVSYLVEKRLGKLREDADTRIPTRADLEQTYKDGRITKADYIDRLDKMGYTLADAQLIADNAESDLIGDVVDEWQRTYEYRTRYGRMTAAELRAALVDLGKSDAYAEARAAYIAEMAAGKTGEVEEVAE